MKCPICYEIISPDSEKCPLCGHDLTKYKKCTECGELLEKSDLYCPYCGVKQPEGNKSKVVVPPIIEEPPIEIASPIIEESMSKVERIHKVDDKEAPIDFLVSRLRKKVEGYLSESGGLTIESVKKAIIDYLKEKGII